MTEPALSPCAALVRAGDPDRFLSAMTAPPERRERLMALYAFNLEVARIPAVVSEPMLGEIRLAWWRESIAQIYEGAPVRRHEVVEPLAAAIQEAGLRRDLFETLLEARRFDIHADPHADIEACLAYLRATSGGLMLLSAQALGESGGEAAVADLGLAMGVANLLAAVPALLAMGHQPIPFDAAPRDLNALAEGRVPEGFAAAVASLAREGLAAHRRARKAGIPRAARPAARAAWRARPVLETLAADPGLVLALPRESEFRRRAGLLWRALSGRW